MFPIFFIITIISVSFILVKCIIATGLDLYSKNDEGGKQGNGKIISIVIDSLFFISIAITQIIMFVDSYPNIKDHSIFILYIVLPIILIVFPIYFIINFLPNLNIIGPFSNTFGYLFTLIGGIKNYYERILNMENTDEKLKNLLSENATLIVNEMKVTTFWEDISQNSNNNRYFKKLTNSKGPINFTTPEEIFENNADKQNTLKDYKALFRLLSYKNIIAEYIWYTIALIVSITITASNITSLQFDEGDNTEDDTNEDNENDEN
jgi:hypothetical protein